MRLRIAAVTCVFGALALTALAARAAMTTVPARGSGDSSSGKPAPESPAAPAPTPSPSVPEAGPADQSSPAAKFDVVGQVVYAKDGRVVAEIKSGAKVAERFLLYDPAFRPKGEATASKALDKGMFLLKPVGSAKVAVGDRVARVGP